MLVELCDRMADLLDPFGKIPQAKEPVESITLLRVVKIEEPEMVGKVLEMTKMFTEQEGNDDENRDIFKELMEDYAEWSRYPSLKGGLQAPFKPPFEGYPSSPPMKPPSRGS